jgi:hypothetical protein
MRNAITSAKELTISTGAKGERSEVRPCLSFGVSTAVTTVRGIHPRPRSCSLRLVYLCRTAAVSFPCRPSVDE